MSATLSIRIKGQPSQKVVVEAAFAIGRDAGNDWVLDDPRVSRNHALIRLQQGGRYCVVDLGSANGTFLNGQRITRPATLRTGDAIQIANCQLLFFAASGERESATEYTSMGTLDDRQECTVAVLVADIRGYTRLAEHIPPASLSELVGGWFRDAGRIILECGGSVDKFIGDAVMAFWLAEPGSHTARCARGALNAAQEIVRLAGLYHARVSAAYPGLAFDVGCGVSMGRAVLGNVGLDARKDFTLMGDCVNVAFRLEALCGELGRQVLVSQDVHDMTRDHFTFEDLGPQTCRGRSESVRVFALQAPPAREAEAPCEKSSAD